MLRTDAFDTVIWVSYKSAPNGKKLCLIIIFQFYELIIQLGIRCEAWVFCMLVLLSRSIKSDQKTKFAQTSCIALTNTESSTKKKSES
jgi:hypothetical protein